MSQIQTIPYRTTFLENRAKESWDFFKEVGYPTSKNEEWRFSNPLPWIPSKSSNHVISKNSSSQMFIDQNINDGVSIIISNESILIPKKIPKGIEILDMFQAMQKNILEGSIGSVEDFHNSPFSAENMAQFNNGIVIYVQNNTKLTQPIQLIHHVKNSTNCKLFPRVFLDIGAGSNIQVIQTEISDDEKQQYLNSVIEVIVHENAILNWTLMQNWNLLTGHVDTFNIALEKDAVANYDAYDFGGGFIRRNIIANLYSTGCNFNLNGLFLPGKKQHMDIFSKVYHKAPQCSSNQLFKGVLSGSASGVFRGLSYVDNKSCKTNAKQSNHNLLLSKKAKINSIPQLEIYENDVKCTHGSTTGQINEEAVFYLQSRGISRIDATKLMINGFVNELMNNIENKKLKIVIEKAFNEKMKEFIY